MTFLRYPHLERYGNEEVADIEFGITHVFPKLDGTNASVWFEGTHDGECDSTIILGAGSRNRPLETERDNAGFCQWVRSQCSYGAEEKNPLELFFWEPANRNYILYGEWLVPHTIKQYREDAWRRFWIFDVFDRETNKFLHYDEYKILLDHFGLDYIPCIKIYKNGSYDNFLHEAQNNAGFLLPDGVAGEGVVIKNYNYTNKYNRVTWAKIVRQEFKDQFHAAMGASVQEVGSNAQIICDAVVTPHLVEKEYSKIVNEEGHWHNRFIPRLLHTVFYSVVKEELWDMLKKINHGPVNFQELKHLCIQKTKQLKPELF